MREWTQQCGCHKGSEGSKTCQRTLVTRSSYSFCWGNKTIVLASRAYWFGFKFSMGAHEAVLFYKYYSSSWHSDNMSHLEHQNHKWVSDVSVRFCYHVVALVFLVLVMISLNAFCSKNVFFIWYMISQIVAIY